MLLLYMLDKAALSIVSPCLWDTIVENLDITNDSFLIIERLLEHGGDKQVEFVLLTYDKDTIAAVIKRSSYLSPQTVNYWCLYYCIKKEDTRCFTQQFQRVWPPSLAR